MEFTTTTRSMHLKITEDMRHHTRCIQIYNNLHMVIFIQIKVNELERVLVSISSLIRQGAGPQLNYI